MKIKLLFLSSIFAFSICNKIQSEMSQNLIIGAELGILLAQPFNNSKIAGLAQITAGSLLLNEFLKNIFPVTSGIIKPDDNCSKNVAEYYSKNKCRILFSGLVGIAGIFIGICNSVK